jgi:DNA polymerase-3 subunit delta'
VAFVRRIERGAKGERRAQILIEQVREEIQDPIAYKPFEGRYKVFVIADAERMTEEAQNCLLKTLEEPPPHSLLILVASRLEPFVDTVISRCQIVRFRPLAQEQAERVLENALALEPERARALARLAGGSPGRAARYLGDGAYDMAQWLLGGLAELRPGGEFLLAADLLDKGRGERGATLEDARDQLRPVLDLLALAWRDLFLRASGCAGELLTWGEACPALAALGEGLRAEAARRLAALTLEARNRVDANANIKLLLETLILDTGAFLRAGKRHQEVPSRTA